MNIDINTITDKLLSLLKIPSPSGNTDRAMDYTREIFKEIGLESKVTEKGALVISIPGKETSKSRTLSAHVDTLGAMVKEITPDGKLKISQLGGYVLNTIEGEQVEIETLEGKIFTGTVLTTKASSHVHGKETESIDRNLANMEIRIDEKVKTKDDVEKLGISVGDFISFDPRASLTPSGFIKSRHLDDKAGLIAIWGMAKYLVENDLKPAYTSNFFISHYEEVGHGASSGIPKDTFEFIAVDMAAPGSGQTSDEFSVTICAKDSTGPYDLEIRRRLIMLCKENNINYKVDIYPFYGSDASAALRAGYDFRVGLIGPGVDASHSYERTHQEAIKETIKLGVNYILAK